MNKSITSWLIFKAFFFINVQIVLSNPICFRWKHLHPVCKTDDGKFIQYKPEYESSMGDQIKYRDNSIDVIRNYAFVDYQDILEFRIYSKVLVLDLADSSIIIEPYAIALKGLERLEITSGPVQLESKSFQELSNLKHLKLKVNETLVEIGQVLKNLPNLTSLELLDNHTIGICGSSNDPVQIKILQYTGGFIKRISSELFECLKNLEELTITKTMLSLVEPGAFNFLKYLKKLSLTDNFRLISIPPFNFDKLEILDLSENSIGSLDEITISMNANCQLLNLSYNILNHFKTWSFNKLKCVTVDLGVNRLESIYDDAFEESNITTLLLDDNYIKNSDDKTQWGIGSETKIYFHINPIDYVESNIQSEKENTKCYFSEKFCFFICQRSNLLLAVHERIMPYRLLTKTLVFERSDIILTEDFVFYHLSIENLIIESSAKPFQLIAESLRGLPRLENLQLDTQPILIKNTTFFYIRETLKQLSLSVNESQTFLCDSLQRIKNLLSLTIVNHDAFTFCNEICYEKGNNLKFKYLRYNGGSFGTVQSNAFSCLKNLENLFIDNTNITGFDSDAFNGLDNLVMLSLYSNHKLTQIGKNVFGQMKNLKNLILSSNSIEFIEDGAFSKLDNHLSFLDLSQNKLHTISDRIFEGISSIDQLDLSSNDILHFEYNSTGLVYAYNNSQLFSIGESKKLKVKLFCRNDNLWIICMNGTSATSITLNRFGSTLQISDEEKNNFQIEISIDNITSIRNDAWKNIASQLTIKSLILNKNIRDGLALSPNSFDGLSKLENLELNVGPTIIQYGAFNKLSNLNRLQLQFNGTQQYLDKYLMSLKLLTSLNFVKIQSVDICGNQYSRSYPPILYLSYIKGPFTLIRRHSFICLRYLKYLRVTKTNLTTIEPDAFIGLDHLEIIDLSYNKLKRIVTHVFNNLKVLSILRLNDNEITDFEMGSLMTINNNYTLINVSYNKIVDIPEKTFSNLVCKVFDIRENPLLSTTRNIMGYSANIGELIDRLGHRIHPGQHLKADEPQHKYIRWTSGKKNCHGRYNLMPGKFSQVCRKAQASKLG